MPSKIKDPKKRREFKQVQKDLKSKVGLFNRMKDECLACCKPFDKTNKDMVKTWNVTVKTDSVNLYCPECWNEAIKTIEGLHQRVEKRGDNEI